MNTFDYKLKQQEIGRTTKKTDLRKLISAYMTKADSNYKSYYQIDRYRKDDFTKVNIALKYFELGKLAVARWEELEFDLKQLPDYTKRAYVEVDIRMSLEHAVKLLGSKDNE